MEAGLGHHFRIRCIRKVIYVYDVKFIIKKEVLGAGKASEKPYFGLLSKSVIGTYRGVHRFTDTLFWEEGGLGLST